MKEKMRKKLTLKKVTVASLNDAHLEKIAGGTKPPTQDDESNVIYPCNTEATCIASGCASCATVCTCLAACS